MTERVTNKWAVYAATLVAVTLWGMSYLWSDRLIHFGIPVEYFVFIRVLAAGVLLLLFNLCCGYSLRMRLHDLGTFALLALCEPLIYFVCETYGIKFTASPTYSALIIAMTPVVAFAAGVLFFKEKMTRLNVIGILICLGGLFLVTWCSSSVGDKFFLGVLLLLIAVFAEVGQASFTKILAAGYKPSVIVMYQFLIGSVFLLPLFLSRGLESFTSQVYFSWEVVRPILCLAVLCSSVAFSLWAVTVKHLGVAKSSIFQAMIPVVTALIGVLLGHEILTGLQWAGIAVSCIGLICTQMGCRKA